MSLVLRCLTALVFAATPLTARSASLEAQTRLPLLSLIAGLDHAEKNSIGPMPNDQQTLSSFTHMLEQSLTGTPDSAITARAGYSVESITQNDRHYIVLRDAEAAIGPTIVLAAAPRRDLIFEAPHGGADRATDIQSAIAFTRLGARALILAGAHRCAARSESVCSGKSRICGDGREPYRSSDGAHNIDTRFHLAHTLLAEAWPQATVVQLHGFGVKGTSSWVVISDGSRENRPGDTALTGQVRDGVRSWFDRPERAVSCQDPDDKRYRYRALCARTNVQGRHLNGSTDACWLTSETATGRFLHVEQAWQIRREVRDHWAEIDRYPLATVVINALGKALPCTLSACR